MCRRKAACSLCKLDTSQTFTLKGLPDQSRETERSYRIRLTANSSLSLLGRRNLTDIVEEGGEWLSSKIEVDEDEIKIDVKVEDMLGDLSWYFNDSSAKGKSESRRASKGSRRASKAEQEKEKEEREENGSDEVIKE